MKPEMIARLRDLAKRKCWCDNEEFIAEDWAGGNFDDAYSGGVDDGYAMLAQEILESLDQKEVTS